MAKTRSERRHHHKRMIEKVKNFPYMRSLTLEWYGTEKSREKHILKLSETRTPCSCWMCGNPRRKLKQKSLKEKISILNQKEELNADL
jgi:hypothetical protein